MNNDGASKVSFTAPSVDGHAGVIALAQALAGIDPQTISYVEAHGTATPLGDPVEIAGLTQAFRAGGATGTGYCAIGSVKSNVGHLDAAAGVAGLIKTALALHHKAIPPSLHFTAPNPKLDLEATPFRVVTSLRPVAVPRGLAAARRRQLVRRRRDERPRGSGGGSRRHRVPPGDDDEQLIVLSARSASALDAATSRLRDHLVDHPGDAARRRGVHAPDRPAAVLPPPGPRGRGNRRRDRAARRARSRHDVTGSSTVEEALGRVPVPGTGSAVRGHGARVSTTAIPAFGPTSTSAAAVLRPQLGLRPARRALSRAGRRRAGRAAARPDGGHPARPVRDRVRAGDGVAPARESSPKA